MMCAYYTCLLRLFHMPTHVCLSQVVHARPGMRCLYERWCYMDYVIGFPRSLFLFCFFATFLAAGTFFLIGVRVI